MAWCEANRVDSLFGLTRNERLEEAIKADVTGGDANPRFVVAWRRSTEGGGWYLYERIYCARGEMENRIKECQLDWQWLRPLPISMSSTSPTPD